LASAALSYVRDRRWPALVAALAGGFVGVFFAQDAIMALPGLYCALVLSARRAKGWTHFLAIGLVGLATVCVLFAFYWFLWRQMSAGGGEETAYWGRKYDVFYVHGDSPGSPLSWFIEKYRELAVYPGSRRGLWRARGVVSSGMLDSLREIDAAIWVVLHAIGLVVLMLRRCLEKSLVAVMPFLVLIAFNQLGFWPFGDFRTNLFMLVYTSAIAAFALDARAGGGLQLRALVPAFVLVLLPLLHFERVWHRSKESVHTTQTAFPQAFEALLRRAEKYPRARREPLVVDYSSCAAWKYYTRFHPSYAEFRAHLRKRFDLRCTWRHNPPVDLVRRVFNRHRRVWFMTVEPDVVERLDKEPHEGLRIVEQARPGAGALVLSFERE
jgi:hypothetical protein